jgi:hypothetical protein
MAMATATSSRTRLMIIAAAFAAVVIVVVAATRGDDAKPPATSATSTTAGLVEIQSPASVTGLSSAGAAPSGTTSGSSDIAAVTDFATFSRALIERGDYNCANTGEWKPYADLQVVLRVGEPAPGQTCTSDVLDLAVGTCSATPCSEVPADWRIDLRDGESGRSLMMVVAPTVDGNAEFVCIAGLIPQAKQVLPAATTIEQVCTGTATSNSTDIPYVPPPISVDLPAG